MKRLSILTATALLLAASISGCSQPAPENSTNSGEVVEVVDGGQGSSPEDPLPFGATYRFDDGMEITVGEPTPITLSGLSADDYDLSVGDPVGVDFRFVNTGEEETMTSGIFIEMVSLGEIAELVLNSEAKRVFHSGLTDAYTEEEILEMPPLVMKSNKAYDFQVGFIVADPGDLLLGVSDTIDRTLFFSN